MKLPALFFLIAFMFTVRGDLDLASFKRLLQKYQNSSGVTMVFNKQAYFPLLKKSKTSQGEFFLSGQKISLNLKDHLKTQILFDGQKWWHIMSPPGEQKKVSPISPDQNISLLFHPKAFFRGFRFVSQETKGRTQILHFAPKNKQAPLRSLSVQVEQDRILKVWLKWQGSGNEEVFSFSNIRFNQKLSSALFSRPSPLSQPSKTGRQNP